MRNKGKIASWNDARGYGFIAPLAGGKQIFIHISALSNRQRQPQSGDVVTYSVSSDKRGRPCASNASLAGDKLKEKAPRKASKTGILFAGLFLVLVCVLALVGMVSNTVPIAYISLSVVTYLAYALDKSAAKRGAWRTSEGTLHLLGLFGGWPGAVIAQQTLRHKSKKTSFRVTFWITAICNCGALFWWCTRGS
jgi:uncharacterized membrane protein YsdA (DUF1294 family)/cold shock CspA family protein